MSSKITFRGDPVIIQGNSGVPLTTYVGRRGELVMDYSNNTIRVHDGITSGGIVYQASTIAQLSAASTLGEVITAYNLLISGMRVARLMA